MYNEPVNTGKITPFGGIKKIFIPLKGVIFPVFTGSLYIIPLITLLIIS